jgi:hypothetical protein
VAKLTYPCDVEVDLELDRSSVRFIKRQCELLGACAWYAVPRDQHYKCLNHGLVEGVHFSHEPSPFHPVGKITYQNGQWKEAVYG